MKTAIVCKDKTGYWIAVDNNGNQIGPLYDSEIEAIRAANYYGYLVR